MDRVESTDGAEVDQPERAVLEREDVAGVRVGVEEAEPQHLIERGREQLLGERGAVDVRRVQPLGVGQGEAFEPFLHEQSARGELEVDLRDPDGRGGTEQQRHLRHGVGFAQEVELGAQALRELAEHLAGPHSLAERGAPLREVGDERERGEVALHHVPDAGTLDLHDDGFTGSQPGAMRLTDRRRRQRFPLELGEDALDGVAQLGFQDLADGFGVGGRDAVLQLRQLVGDLGRHEVDACGGDLTELDVDAARFLEHEPEPHTRVGDGAFLAAGGGDERAEALAPDEAHELAVPAQHREPHADRAAAVAARRRARRAPPSRACPGERGDPSSPRWPSWPGSRSRTCGGSPRRRPSPSRRCSARRARRRPQPISPDTSAVIQPRRMPRRRSASAVVSTATTIATSTPRTTSNTERREHQVNDHDPPGHGGAVAPQSLRSLCSRTLATSVCRGWKASALSASKIKDALARPSNANSYVTQPPGNR